MVKRDYLLHPDKVPPLPTTTVPDQPAPQTQLTLSNVVYIGTGQLTADVKEVAKSQIEYIRKRIINHTLFK